MQALQELGGSYGRPQTLVLLTGDGNANEGRRASFVELAQQALLKGWRVEVPSKQCTADPCFFLAVATAVTSETITRSLICPLARPSVRPSVRPPTCTAG